jgi:endonuclease/exonuclease/phosphatase family metal-dependent hydrolase
MRTLKFWGVLLLSAALLSAALLSCTAGQSVPGAAGLTLATWNVQTFFDGETTGTEYAEFRGASSAWSRDKYLERLQRLCQTIKTLDADILALEEIENQGALYDIANHLRGLLPPDKVYPYGCFAIAPGSSIGCAVLSRIPLENLTVHSCDYQSPQAGDPPLMRPLMEVTLEAVKGMPRLKLFVAHWKSKSGVEDQADFWQTLQESVLARRVRRFLEETAGEGEGQDQSQGAVLICGDFNRRLEDFTQSASGTITLSQRTAAPFHADYGEEVPQADCDSGWLLFPETITGPGSYFFREEWEKIDHIFVAGTAVITQFSAQISGPWVKTTGGEPLPYRYSIRTGSGYSDHLPLRCVIQWKR